MKKLALTLSLLALAACARNGHTDKNSPLSGTSVAETDLEAKSDGTFVTAGDSEVLAALPAGAYFQMNEDLTFSDDSLKTDPAANKATDFSFWRLIKIDDKFFYGGSNDQVVDDESGNAFSIHDLVAAKKNPLFIPWFTPKLEKAEGENVYVLKADQKLALRSSRHPEADEIRFHLDETCFKARNCAHGQSLLAIKGTGAPQVTVAQLKQLLGNDLVVSKPDGKAPAVSPPTPTDVPDDEPAKSTFPPQ